MATPRTFNRRRHERVLLQPMYTAVTARRHIGASDTELGGHAYDISESGVRIELDETVSPGEAIELEICVPSDRLDVHATGSVVRLFEADDDPGPRRIGVEFTGFSSAADRQRLLTWLGGKHLLRAA